MQTAGSHGFSPFSWALAIFCLPSALWPLGLFVSAKFGNSSALTDFQLNLFSVIFWVYPVALLAISGVLYRWHRTQPRQAKLGLIVSFIAFYALFFYIVKSV